MGAKAADDDHIPMIQPETGGASGPGPGADPGSLFQCFSVSVEQRKHRSLRNDSFARTETPRA